MPIYEFYCEQCNTLFNFLSRRIQPDARPDCPRCGETLERRMSRFAVLKQSAGGENDKDEMPDLPFSEQQLMNAMQALEGEVGSVDESDPRALARLMRKFSDAAGMEFGEKMESVLHRLERGEDPDALEQEMGDLGEDGDLMDFIRAKKSAVMRKRPPQIDDTLYEM
jgi:putative FmdB family regulatory protein